MFPGHNADPGGTFEWLAPPPGAPPGATADGLTTWSLG